MTPSTHPIDVRVNDILIGCKSEWHLRISLKDLNVTDSNKALLSVPSLNSTITVSGVNEFRRNKNPIILIQDPNCGCVLQFLRAQAIFDSNLQTSDLSEEIPPIDVYGWYHTI